MSKRPKRVFVLYDLPEPVADHADPRYLLDHDDRPTEKDVCRAIKELGLELFVHGVFDQTGELWHRLSDIKPDVVFNLCETFKGDRSHEGDVASILELANLPYTGSQLGLSTQSEALVAPPHARVQKWHPLPPSAIDSYATLQFEMLFYPVDILSGVSVSFASVVVMTRDVVLAWLVIFHWRRASWQFTSVTSRNRLCSINQWLEHGLRLRSSMLLMSK